MSQKINYEKIEKEFNALVEKGENVSEEEAIERGRLELILSRRAAALKFENLKHELREAKIHAMYRILEANRITTENELKAIFDVIQKEHPDLIPPEPEPEPEKPKKKRKSKKKEGKEAQPAEEQKPEAEKPAQPTEQKNSEAEQPEEQPKGEAEQQAEQAEEKPEGEADQENSEADQPEGQEIKKELFCENCGAKLVKKIKKDGTPFMGCPNWKPGEEHTSCDIPY